MGADYNAVKDIPGYKIIMKAILKSQIQHLVDQLSVEAEEETVMLTASMTDGMLCHLGSNSGKIFLDNHEDFKSMFLNFCLKEKHEKRQQEKQIPSNNETSRNRSTPGPIRSSKQVPGQTKQISTPPQSSTPRGRSVRMQPYPVSKPTKTPTATSQKVNHTSTTPQRQNETATTSQTSNPEVATIKKEPLDPEVVTLPDTIEGYQILRTEADPAEGEQDQSNTGDKETDENKQNGQTGLSDTAANASANVTLSNAAISGANANAKAGVSDIDKQGVKPESLAEAELDTTDADMDVSVNIEDSLDMSELEQPGPSGLASGDVSSLEQSDQLNSASDETGELDNKPFQFNYIITEPANDDGPSSSDFPVLQGNKSFDSSTYGDLNKFWMQTEDQATIKQMRWATKLLQDSASDETGELDNKPFQFNYIITEPANDDGPSSSDFPVLQGNKSFDSSTYGDLNKFWMQTEDQATIKQMRWATKLLQDWMTEEGYGSVIFEDLPSFEMDRLLQQFYTAARTKDGKEYSRSTLIGLRSALNRYLTNPPFSRDINILKDREFRESNQVMSDLFKRLKRDGKDPSHKEPICDEDLQKLYNSRVFSLTSPKTLQNKVMFDVISHFGKIKQDGLRTLLKSSFICKLDDKGKKYVTLMVDESDERLYNLNRMYENDGVFCPIKSYELYVSKLNPASDLFFQSPLYSFSDDDPVWFSTRGVGINTFSTFMSRMSEKASLSRKYTNQCICARTVYKITKQPCVQLNFT